MEWDEEDNEEKKDETRGGMKYIRGIMRKKRIREE